MKQSIAEVQQAIKMQIEAIRIESMKPWVIEMYDLEVLLVTIILTLMVGIMFNTWWDCCDKHPREKGENINNLLRRINK